MGFFQHVEMLPSDPIFGLMERFKRDERAHKMNLGIGVYKDGALKTPTMEAVKRAERLVLEKDQEKVYLPISGDLTYLDKVGKLCFGERFWQEKASRFCSFQTIGGTGALRLGAECLRRAGFTKLHLPSPTWANHNNIFKTSGFEISTYPYYNKEKNCLSFDEMKVYLMQQEKGVVLFHSSCHNPSGADLSSDQWEEIAQICSKRELFPFFDSAYLGFANGLEEDAFALRYFAEKGIEFFLSVSFSKIMGLYGERVGALIGFSPAAAVIGSVIKSVVRSIYSNPPRHGAAIVAEVLGKATLRQLWEDELVRMRERILTMRQKFAHALQEKQPDTDYSYIEGKNGMFTFCGLTPKQVDRLINDHAIYMTQDGRINLSGLTDDTLPVVVEAITRIKSS